VAWNNLFRLEIVMSNGKPMEVNGLAIMVATPDGSRPFMVYPAELTKAMKKAPDAVDSENWAKGYISGKSGLDTSNFQGCGYAIPQSFLDGFNVGEEDKEAEKKEAVQLNA